MGQNLTESPSVTEQLDENHKIENINEDPDDTNNVADDSASFEWAESDLWKQTKPISVIKDISKKIKARRTSERRRFSIYSFRTF